MLVNVLYFILYVYSYVCISVPQCLFVLLYWIVCVNDIKCNKHSADLFSGIRSVSQHLSVYVWVPEFSIYCRILNMFWNVNWNKNPGIKLTWLSFVFLFGFFVCFFNFSTHHGRSVWQRLMVSYYSSHHWTIRCMKSSGGTKVRQGVISATLGRLCGCNTTNTRTSLRLSHHFKLNSDQQRKAEEQQQMSVSTFLLVLYVLLFTWKF